jgi:hypothetical protein
MPFPGHGGPPGHFRGRFAGWPSSSTPLASDPPACWSSSSSWSIAHPRWLMRSSSNAHQGASKSDATKDPARLNHGSLPSRRPEVSRDGPTDGASQGRRSASRLMLPNYRVSAIIATVTSLAAGAGPPSASQRCRIRCGGCC